MRRLKQILVSAALFAVLAAPAWADVQDGWAAYQRSDYRTALREWRPLAERGVAQAQFNLGVMYEDGQGVPQNYAKAARWYHMAARQGFAPAQYLLGDMYNNGKGVPYEPAEAAIWFRRAAEQGIAEAQFSLGLMYHKGQGVKQDYAEAAKWYRRAAAQGNAGAQFGVGQLYASGRGVPQSDAGAVKWYRLAVNQGYALAQTALGLKYILGVGVPRDYVLAHMWLNLGTVGLPQGDKLAVELRDSLEEFLTPSQLAEAQRRAREWRPRQRAAISPDTVGPWTKYQSADKRRRVARVQGGLASLGYDPGPADGILGPKTRAAIRAFEADNDLAVTGEISDELDIAVLRARAARGKPLVHEKFDTSALVRVLERHSTGSGFAVSNEGHFLTNHHVVKDCREVRLPTDVAVKVIAVDIQSDLALLEKPVTHPKFATFSQGRGVRPGVRWYQRAVYHLVTLPPDDYQTLVEWKKRSR